MCSQVLAIRRSWKKDQYVDRPGKEKKTGMIGKDAGDKSDLILGKRERSPELGVHIRTREGEEPSSSIYYRERGPEVDQGLIQAGPL